jgi:hypothetical protein
MPHSSSDAIIDVLRIGCDGIRFRFAAQLHLPSFGRDGPPEQALTTLYGVWIQAVSPPPQRTSAAGATPWEQGIRVRGGSQAGLPFTASTLGPGQDNRWKQLGVSLDENIAALGTPDPATIVLDQGLTVPFEWGREIAFRDEVDPLGFLSVRYSQPPMTGPVTNVGVNYYGEYTLAWRWRLQPGAWVALSFDRFRPPERKSADFITQVEDRNLFAPTQAAAPTQAS